MPDVMPPDPIVVQCIPLADELLHVIFANIRNAGVHRLEYGGGGKCFSHSDQPHGLRISPRPYTGCLGGPAYLSDGVDNHGFFSGY
jgi:hypothetical protein